MKAARHGDAGRKCRELKMAEREQQELQKGFQKLGDNIDKLYARPLQKVRVLLVPLFPQVSFTTTRKGNYDIDTLEFGNSWT